MREHARPGQQHLTRTCSVTGPVPGIGTVHGTTLGTPFHHVPMVRRQDHDATHLRGEVEQRGQVLDGVHSPVGPPGVGLGQRIIDRVQHDPDDAVRALNRLAHAGRQLLASRCPQVVLME